MNAENFITKSKFFFNKNENESLEETINRLKSKIISYLTSENYTYAGPVDFFNNYLEMKFILSFHSFKESIIKKFFGASSQDQYTDYYFKHLKSSRDEIPFQIRVHIYSGNDPSNNLGIFIEVISEPVIFYKITQMNETSSIDKEKYSFILYENKKFLGGLAKALNLKIIQQPSVLDASYYSELSKKLRIYEFDKVANLFEKGSAEYETGKIPESISNLIGVIENFLEELITKVGGKPQGLHNPEYNIDELKNLGWVNNEALVLLRKTWYHQIYHTLKDKDHKKEILNKFELELMYNISESVIEYLLEKILKYKIK